MKYVMFQCRSEGKPTLLLPVIFPTDLVHADVAKMIERVKVEPDGPFSGWWMRPKPVSAGFFLNSVCHGRSDSLGLGAHPADTAIVAEYMTNGRMVTPAIDRVERP